MADWIDTFVELTATIRSPVAHRIWAAIGAISSVLERKVWTETDVKPLLPNLYIILAGPPAAGKTNALKEARSCIAHIPKLHLAPDEPTREAWLDHMVTTSKQENGFPFPYMASNIFCEEFGSLIGTISDSWFTMFTTLYDLREIYTAPRRKSTSVTLDFPVVNMILCGTPAALGKLPQSVWGEGFMSRVNIIYSPKINEKRDAFKRRPKENMEWLKEMATKIYEEFHGAMMWEEDARLAFNNWYNSGMQPLPEFQRLFYYNGRRDTMLMKLAMVSAVSRFSMTVSLADFLRARKWLEDSEKAMPDVFTAMHAKSDIQVMQDTHYYIHRKYHKQPPDARKPIEENDMWLFMAKATTTDKIPALITAMEKTGRIRRSALKAMWIPNPLPESDAHA